jgi:phosphoglycerate dehydrogenase-like enzyme
VSANEVARVSSWSSAAGPPVALIMGAGPQDAPRGLERIGERATLRYAPDPPALAAALPEADLLFFWRAEREELPAVWDRATRLRWIQSASAGVDALLFPALVASDVVVTNARGVFDEPIAEWVMGVLLAVSVDLVETLALQREQVWRHRETRRFAGSRVLVVGPGPIGRAIGLKAIALGAEVSLVGREPRPDPVFGRVLGIDALAELLPAADHVVNALPLTEGTRRLFDERAFAAMGPRTSFVNIGRGATVDEEALIGGLRAGRPAFAALDVFDVEPLPASSPLWSLPGVIVSPHMCGDVAGWEDAVVDIFVDNVGRFVRGEPLRNLVDKRLGFGIG